MSVLEVTHAYSSLLWLRLSLISAFCLPFAVAGIPFSGFWRRRTLIGLLRQRRKVNLIVIGTSEFDLQTDRP